MLNLEVTVVDAMPPGDALMLDVYADRISGAVWKLGQDRMLAAIEEGHRVEQLEEFLEARNAHELPGTVRRFLRDLAERGALLKDRGPAQLIECTDHALAALIAYDTRTRPYCFLRETVTWSFRRISRCRFAEHCGRSATRFRRGLPKGRLKAPATQNRSTSAIVRGALLPKANCSQP